MPNEPATEAIAAFNALIAGVTFPDITDDLSDVSFNLPAQTGILYDTPTAITVDTLTDGTVGGTGTFDKIMTSLRAHLIEEFDNDRITGREYAEVYQGITAAALANSVQFLLTAETAAYNNALIQMQGRAAEHQVIAARAGAVQAKFAAIATKAESETMKANYALTKMNVGVQDITYSKIEQDVAIGVAQAAGIVSQTSITDYQRSDILTEEKRKLTYEIDNILAAQYAKLNFEAVTLLPSQNADVVAATNIKTFQHTNILPAQEDLLQEQREVQRAQTLDVRSDNITSIAGAIGKQKELYDEQISSYRKDARYKSAKLWTDAWITQKSLDEGLLPPTQFTNAEIDEVLSSLKTDLSLGTG